MGDCLSEYLHVRSVECFHACVDENKAHIYSVARRILGDAALAEDVTQEVFTKVASARWDPETIRSGKAFLSQVAISIARTRRRTHRKRRRRENPLETAACQVSNAPDVDRILDVREAVERLPTELRLWVELKFYCDLTPAEISTHLGISERVAQRRLTVAYELLRKRLATPAMTTLSGALLALQAQTHAFPPALDERLQQLVAQQSPHPPRRVGKLSLSAILAASVVLISALAVVALGTRRVERPEVATPLDDAAATPLRATGRQRPWLRAPDGWREAWRQLALRWQQVDWEALRDKVAQLDVEREAIGEIRIEDSDGTLFKSGRINLIWPIAAQSESTLTPGVVGIAPGVLKQVLSGELADANPLTFPVHAEVLGASLRLRVAIDGHPLVEKDDVIFGTGTTRVKVTVPSRPRTLVRVLEGWREVPVTEALLKASPALHPDGTLRQAPTITASETAPGVYALHGHDDGLYDVALTSVKTFPLLREAVQLSGELQLWAHPAQQRTGNATVEVFGPDEQPWAQTPVTVRIGSRVITGQTDDQGRCRFDDLPAENLLFRLPRGDTVPWPGSYVIECRRLVRPARDVHITLGSPKCDARLVVEVVNREGTPLPGVVVKIEGDLYWQLVTDAVGQAAFERIAAGDYRVGLRGSALATSTAWASDQVVTVKAGEDRRERLELGASTLRGRVLAGSTAGLQLLVRRPDKQKSGQAGGDPRDPPGHNLLAATTVDANGNFFFTHTPHGEQRVSIVGEHRGVVCRRELTVEVPPDGDPAPVELRLLGLGVLRVEVTDPDGKPIRRGRVECFGREGRVPLPRRSSGARGIEFAAMLDPGAYRIEATTGTGSPVTRSLVIEPGEEEHVVIVLGR